MQNAFCHKMDSMHRLRGTVSIILITLFSIVETSRVLFLFRTRKSNRIKKFKIKISLTSKSHNFYQIKLLLTISLKILLMQTNHAYSSMHPSSQIPFNNSNGAYCNVTYQVACFVSLNSHFQSFKYFSMASYRRTRNSNSKKIMPKFGRVDVVKFSFFFSIIPTWNSLPENIVSQCNSESFFSLCRLHISKESSCKM